MKKSVFTFVAGLAMITLTSYGILSSEKISNGKSSNENINSQQQKTAVAVKEVYSCPMHPEVTQDKAGKCSKCGMDLVLKKAAKDVYACPMHPEVSQDKPGKCTKCGMDLVKKEAAKAMYTCPMHSDVKQEKAGKCPKCGMNLVKI
jgi:Cu(I)/Ag(I) efflux system membrane fusion protein